MKPPRHQRGPTFSHRESGYTLPMVILIAGATAVWIGSLIHFTQGEVRMAHQSFHMNSSLNLAEGAAERALHAIHNEFWTDWSVESSNMVMDPIVRDLGGGVTGTMQARVEDLATLPTIFATGIIQVPNQPEIRRELVISLEQRTFFRNALTANEIIFQGGNTFVDSYNSEAGLYDYDTNRNDQAILATTSVDSINVGNAHILGYVATGGGLPSVGMSGTILGFDSPEGISIDLNRITTDFSSSFPPVAPPNTYHGELGVIDRDISLPLEGHVAENAHFVYQADSINIRNNTITIDSDVVLHVTGDVSIGGNSGSIHIMAGANAILYVDGDMDVGGRGTDNQNNRPSELLIYGSSNADQSFALAGQSDWLAAIYAPNANVELKRTGNDGKFHGAVVADSIAIQGGYHFHYDESLAAFTPAYSPAPGTYRPGQWDEGGSDPEPGTPPGQGGGGPPGQGGGGPPGQGGGGPPGQGE